MKGRSPYIYRLSVDDKGFDDGSLKPSGKGRWRKYVLPLPIRILSGISPDRIRIEYPMSEFAVKYVNLKSSEYPQYSWEMGVEAQYPHLWTIGNISILDLLENQHLIAAGIKTVSHVDELVECKSIQKISRKFQAGVEA